MMSSDFQKALKEMNSRLSIFCGDDDSKPAGIWYLQKNGEYQPISGIDKNWVPEYSEFDKKGHRIVGGWRRVLRELIARKLITLAQTRKRFGYWNERPEKIWTPEPDKILKELQNHEGDVWKKDDIVDVGREIAKTRPTKPSINVGGE